MSKALTRVFAFLRGLTPAEYRGEAGDKFRRAKQAIGEAAANHGLDADCLLDHASAAVEGTAHEKLAHATKEYAESEKIKVETEIAKRTGEADLRKKVAEATIAEVSATRAIVELAKELNSIGVMFVLSENGGLVVTKLPAHFDLAMNVEAQLLLSSPTHLDVTEQVETLSGEGAEVAVPQISIGDWLTFKRIKKGLEITELAERSRINVTTLSKIESGIQTGLTNDLVNRLSIGLEVPREEITYLLDESLHSRVRD